MSCVANALATQQRLERRRSSAFATQQRSENASATQQRLGRRCLNAFPIQERLGRMLSVIVFVLPRGCATFAVLRLRRIPSNTQKLSQMNFSSSLAGQNVRASSNELVAPFGGDSLGGSLVDSKHGGWQLLIKSPHGQFSACSSQLCLCDHGPY